MISNFALKSRFIFAILMLLIAMSVSASNKKATIYAFGFSASFNDSTIYFTDIQQIDNATIESKNNFLQNRTEYAEQLRDYFNSIGLKHRTCLISYGLTQKDAEKKLVRLRKRYSKGGHYKINYLNGSDFKFKVINREDSSMELTTPQVNDNKKKRKSLP